MKTIIVDDEPMNILEFTDICADLADVELLKTFTSPKAALKFAENNTVEFALLDIEMPVMNGLELAKHLRELNPDIIVVFVTSYPSYTVEAFKEKADYIVYKPYKKEEIVDAVKRAKLLSAGRGKRVKIKTFGLFSVSVDGEPVVISSAKARELLALCVLRCGSPVSAAETVSKLWEDYEGSVAECSNYRMTVKRLISDLEKYGISDIFIRDNKSCRIRAEMVGSDYFRFLDGDADAVCEFQGEFLPEYSWAESKIYELQEKKALHKAKNTISD